GRSIGRYLISECRIHMGAGNMKHMTEQGAGVMERKSKGRGLAGPIAALVAAVFMVAKAHAIAVTDVDFRIGAGPYQNPVQAILSTGNDSVAAINGLFPGDPWTQLDKTDSGSTPFNGVTFVL